MSKSVSAVTPPTDKAAEAAAALAEQVRMSAQMAPTQILQESVEAAKLRRQTEFVINGHVVTLKRVPRKFNLFIVIRDGSGLGYLWHNMQPINSWSVSSKPNHVADESLSSKELAVRFLFGRASG